MRRVGIYGGTFSPPHNGHTEAARRFITEASLDELIIMPSLISPHKPTSDTDEPEYRLNMLRAAFADDEKITVSDYEIKRGGVSYTYKTLTDFSSPDTKLIFLVGSDMFLSLDTWREPEIIFSLADIFCISRQSGDLAALHEKKAELERNFGARCIISEKPALEISSGKLRGMIENGEDISPLVCEGVNEYIKVNGLYRYPVIKSRLHSTLSDGRYRHCLSVAKTALSIARGLGFDDGICDSVYMAGLLHDITKETDLQEQLEIVRRAGFEPTEDDITAESVLHQFSGACLARELYGVDDIVFNMIRYHCTGRSDMSTIEKIIFISDYIEPNRRHKLCERLRDDFYSRPLTVENLTNAADNAKRATVEHLRSKGFFIHPLSEQAIKSLN